MTIEELIQKIPEEYRLIARRYTTLLLDMGFKELQDWVDLIATGNWQQAYKAIVAKMPTDEIIAEQKKANELLKKMNKENADMLAGQRAILQQILLTSLLMLRKEIETPSS